MKSLTAFLGAVGMICCCEPMSAQVFTTKSGNWNSPSIWSNGSVPDSSEKSITIAHPVRIGSAVVTADELVLLDSLTIGVDATLILTNSKGNVSDLQINSGGSLNVYGKVVCRDSVVIAGTTSDNTTFRNGSTYEHGYYSTSGEPPQALWDVNSTLLISSFQRSRSLNTSGWTQQFGNVEYNCPNQQASAYVEMLGNLKNIAGNFTIRNTNGGMLRLTLDKTASTTISIGKNFIIEGNSEVWFSRGANTIINVGGDFEYKSTATPSSYLTTAGTCQVNVEGNVLVNTRGILRFASTGGGTGTIRCKRNFDFQSGALAVIAPGRGFAECNGIAKQVITLGGTVSPELTFVINNSTGVAFADKSIVEGSIQVVTGELHFPAQLTLNRDLVVTSGASIDCSKGQLILNGTVNQVLDMKGDTLHHISVNKLSGSSITLSSMVNLSGDLSIQSTNTDVIANGNLTLLSTSDDGGNDASINMLPPGSEIVGDVTVQRFMRGEGRIYRYISSPVANATVASMQDDFPVTGTFENPSSGSGINSTTPSLYWYDESLPAAEGWTPYPASGRAEDNFLKPGRGYSGFIRQANAPTVWDVTGTINQGEISLDVTFQNSDHKSQDGWNLIGNPYPSAIDWNNDMGWQKENVSAGIAIRDNGSGSVVYWDGDIGSMGSGRIAKGQAFWVKATGDNPKLIANENAKTNLSTTFFRKSLNVVDYVELTVTGTGHSDKAYLRLRHDALPGLDDKDVQKLSNDFLNLAFEADETLLAIHATNFIDCDKPIGLQFYFPMSTAGTITPSLKGSYQLSRLSNGLLDDATITLYDSFTNTYCVLSENAYHFSIHDDPASYAKDRFKLYIHTDNSLGDVFVEHDSVFCNQAGYPVKIKHLSNAARVVVSVNQEEAEAKFLDNSTHQEINLDVSVFTKEINEVTVSINNACNTEIRTWNVVPFSHPNISQVNDQLISNYSQGNEWYFNNELISNQSQITPNHSGIFSLTTSTGLCSESVSYDFIYQKESIQLFPNPVNEYLSIVSPRNEHVLQITFMDCLGNLLMQITPDDVTAKVNTFSMLDLPPGLYTVNIFTEMKSYTEKLVKSN